MPHQRLQRAGPRDLFISSISLRSAGRLHQRPQRPEPRNASLAASAPTPSTSNTFRRLVNPPTTLTRLFAIFSCFATNSTNAVLAAPSTGGAASRIFGRPSCRPASSVLAARGCTKTSMRIQSLMRRVYSRARSRVRISRLPHGHLPRAHGAGLGRHRCVMPACATYVVPLTRTS